MALMSDYIEVRMDENLWTTSYAQNETQMLTALGVLIIETLMKYKKPIVFIFDNLSEVPSDTQN